MSNASQKRRDRSPTDNPQLDATTHLQRKYQPLATATLYSPNASWDCPLPPSSTDNRNPSAQVMSDYSLSAQSGPSNWNNYVSDPISSYRHSTGQQTADSNPHANSADGVISPNMINFDNKGAATRSDSTSMGALQILPQLRIKPGVPNGFDRLLHHTPEQTPPLLLPIVKQLPETLLTSRCRLHVRQHPIAARACGAGDRDRRPVDPPPIVQMLLTDYDPESEIDKGVFRDPRLTVGCWLYHVTEEDTTSRAVPSMEYPLKNPQGGQLLSGKTFVSPFNVPSDPDPSTSPTCSTAYSPSYPAIQPATFFIFSDLSICAVGLYKLQFRLMNWGSVEDSGIAMPVLAEAWSDPFRVYPAKDFPGMRRSSSLVGGLKEAGFAELKIRGTGRGKGRRKE